MPTDPSQHVIVIGAGLAGLSCAYEFEQAGRTVTLLEARSKIGGRVSRGRFAQHAGVFELGGEFIETAHTVWRAYAQRFNLTLQASYLFKGETRIELRGKALTSGDARTLREQLAQAEAMLEQECRTIDVEAPWLSADAEAIDTLSVAARFKASNLSPQLQGVLNARYTGLNGVATTKQSYLGLLAQTRAGYSEGGAQVCRGGNQLLAEAFAKRLKPGALHLNTPVRRVTYSQDAAHVVTTDGRVWDAAIVVVAVPAAVLPHIRFDPPLTLPLMPQTGDVIKYVARAPGLWDETPPSTWSDGPVAVTWGVADDVDSRELLACWTGGPNADFCRKSSDIDAFYRAQLSTRFAHYAQRFQAGATTDWQNEAFIGGAYACPAPGEVTRLGPLWAKGFGALQFIGDYTNYAFAGYMEGALRSGTQLVQRLAKRKS